MKKQELKPKVTVKELKAAAKEQKIKGWYLMRKAELIDALQAVERQEPTKPPKAKTKLCLHGKNKYYCKECLGSKFCQHGRQRHFCKECGGNGICIHWNNKYYCKECSGKQICEHNRVKYSCKECGGNGICIHGKDKRHCKDCSQVKVNKVLVIQEDDIEEEDKPRYIYPSPCRRRFLDVIPEEIEESEDEEDKPRYIYPSPASEGFLEEIEEKDKKKLT